MLIPSTVPILLFISPLLGVLFNHLAILPVIFDTDLSCQLIFNPELYGSAFLVYALVNKSAKNNNN